MISVLGVQTQIGGNAFASLVRATWPASLKLIGCTPLPLIAEWRAKRPDGILVYRKWWPDGDRTLAEARARARVTIDEARPLLPYGPVFVEAPWNEERANGDGIDSLAVQTVEFADAAIDAGMIPVVFIFPEASPWDVADLRRPKVIATLRHVVDRIGFVIVGAHGYSAPPLAADDSQHFAVWDDWLDALRDAAPDLVDRVLFYVGECGLDGGINDRKETGWRGYGLSPRQYAENWLRPQHQRMLTCRNVIGSAVFGSEMLTPWNSDHGFDIRDEVGLRFVFTEQFNAPVRLAWTWPPKPKEQPVLRIIDISNNNGHVDLARVKAAGYAGVVLKITEDDWGDDDFFDGFAAENLASARALDLLVAVYTFIRPSKSSPVESVKLVERGLRRLGGLRAGEGIWIDCEDEWFTGDLHVWMAETLDLASRVFGFLVGKYSADFYTSTRNLEHDDLAVYPTWWASYQDHLPAPQVGWGPIRMWQHDVTAPGVVPGVAGRCDVNIFYGTADDWRAMGSPLGWVPPLEWAQAPAIPPEPVVPPAPVEAPPDLANVRAALDRIWQTTLDLAAGGDEQAAIVIQGHIADAKVDLGLQEAA